MLSRLLSLLTFVASGLTLSAQPATVLRLDARNPHYLAYRRRPIVLIGSGEHYGSVVNLDFNYKHTCKPMPPMA